MCRLRANSQNAATGSARQSWPPRSSPRPQHPERVCRGCDLYCPVNDKRCGNGSDRAPHPAELFGEYWAQSGIETAA
ncbi:MAG: DUF3079 domain-containing protein [Giesbergeria sp.]